MIFPGLLPFPICIESIPTAAAAAAEEEGEEEEEEEEEEAHCADADAIEGQVVDDSGSPAFEIIESVP